MSEDNDNFSNSLEELSVLIGKSRNKKLKELFNLFVQELDATMKDYYVVSLYCSMLENASNTNPVDNNVRGRGSRLIVKR